MKANTTISAAPSQVASLVRSRIERGGEHLWRYEDFKGLPFQAVAQALSRLSRAGMIERLSKGVYYRGRETSFGKSRPNLAELSKLATQETPVFPAGIAAANFLGFSTQNPQHGEVATVALSLPRKLVGNDLVIHTRRPAAWASLPETDAALLDFLRQGGKSSELSPEETVIRTLMLMEERRRFARLLAVAHSEPPRVRAMLGAMGEQLGKKPAMLKPLRATLNPLSKFDFGVFSGLTYARQWQSKERRQT